MDNGVVAPNVYREVHKCSPCERVQLSGRLRCSSGLTGNRHEPFLGEGAAATSPPYPTQMFPLVQDLLYLTIVSIIQFFVETDALLRTPSETERNNDDDQ